VKRTFQIPASIEALARSTKLLVSPRASPRSSAAPSTLTVRLLAADNTPNELKRRIERNWW
jgi:hypothetical protein